MIVELSLGSNTHPTENFCRAKELLSRMFPGIVYGQELWTTPYPTPHVPHPVKPYLNCTALMETTLSLADLTQQLKTVEQTLGDSHESHLMGIVRIDIDVLRYGETTIREKKW